MTKGIKITSIIFFRTPVLCSLYWNLKSPKCRYSPMWLLWNWVRFSQCGFGVEDFCYSLYTTVQRHLVIFCKFLPWCIKVWTFFKLCTYFQKWWIFYRYIHWSKCRKNSLREHTVQKFVNPKSMFLWRVFIWWLGSLFRQ